VCMASVSPGVEIFSGLSEAKDEEFHLVLSHGRWSTYHYLSTRRPRRLEARAKIAVAVARREPRIIFFERHLNLPGSTNVILGNTI
jgi:hypothetical protein